MYLDTRLRLLATHLLASTSLLDRHAHQVAPLRPTAVVVPHVRVAQQILEHEPGVARPLADAAIGDDAGAGIEALLLLVELTQLLGGLERAVLRIGRLRPGDTHGALDVAGAQRAFLRVAIHVEELPTVFAGAADVDQRQAGLRVLQHIVAVGTDLVIRPIRRMVGGDGDARHIFGQRPAFLFPFQPAAVHDCRFRMAEQLEDPERVAGPPVALVAVEDDQRVVTDTVARHQAPELLAIQVVARDRIVQVGDPVDLHRAGDVPRE